MLVRRAFLTRYGGIAGAAGLVLTFAPGAVADAAPTTPASGVPTAGADGTSTPTAVRPQDAPVVPNYGSNKFRVGVRIKSGAYVPAGTTTAGSALTITETGPSAPTPLVSTCTTDAAPVAPPPADTTTFCSAFTSAPQQTRRAELARRGSTTRLSPQARALLATPAFYITGTGDTVSVTQTAVAGPALLLDPVAQTVPPCIDPIALGFCAQAADVILVDNGLPPVAVMDVASTAGSKTVVVNVITNDAAHGAPATISSVTQPGHGSVRIVPATSTMPQTLAYTLNAGFSGRDSLSYVLTTANGSATGTVTITVIAPPTPTPATPTPAPTLTPTPSPTATSLACRRTGHPRHR